jgi:hypothetical protein
MVLRKVYGMLPEQRDWRLRTNQELTELYSPSGLIVDIGGRGF